MCEFVRVHARGCVLIVAFGSASLFILVSCEFFRLKRYVVVESSECFYEAVIRLQQAEDCTGQKNERSNE